MRKTLMITVVSLVAGVVSSGAVFAQVADDGVGQGRTPAEQADADKWKYDPDLKRDPWKYYATDVPPGFPDGDGGPAPKRSLTGTWHGPRSSPGVPDGKNGDRPELTALAQQIRPRTVTLAGTVDALGRELPLASVQQEYGVPDFLTITSDIGWNTASLARWLATL